MPPSLTVKATVAKSQSFLCSVDSVDVGRGIHLSTNSRTFPIFQFRGSKRCGDSFFPVANINRSCGNPPKIESRKYSQLKLSSFQCTMGWGPLIPAKSSLYTTERKNGRKLRDRGPSVALFCPFCLPFSQPRLNNFFCNSFQSFFPL